MNAIGFGVTLTYSCYKGCCRYAGDDVMQLKSTRPHTKEEIEGNFRSRHHLNDFGYNFLMSNVHIYTFIVTTTQRVDKKKSIEDEMANTLELNVNGLDEDEDIPNMEMEMKISKEKGMEIVETKENDSTCKLKDYTETKCNMI